MALPTVQHCNGDAWQSRTYAGLTPQEALLRFYQEVLGADPQRASNLVCYQEPEGPEPPRRLMNWECDPNVEASDGWLSNIAAAFANLRDLLQWRPEFCTRAHIRVPCPDCQGTMRPRYGRFGPWYQCQCGKKMSFTRAMKAAVVVGFCGARKEVRINRNGAPYAGCPICHPEGDYERRPVHDLNNGGKRGPA